MSRFLSEVCCSVLQCVAVWCSVLQCGAECCSVLQCFAVCVAVCCSRGVYVCEVNIYAFYRDISECRDFTYETFEVAYMNLRVTYMKHMIGA